MTETRFGAVPTFTAGQVLSAGAHLNALQNVVQAIGDDYMGVQLPFSGNGWTGGTSFEFARQWIGIIRHKKNRVDWNLEVHSVGAGGTVQIYVAGKALSGVGWPLATVGDFTGTNIDITSLGLTVDEFYEVWVVATGEAIWSLKLFCETAINEVPPTLIHFENEVTPTAEQWQDLADYATNLVGRANPPGHFLLSTADGGQAGGKAGGIHLRGKLNHHCRYLAYCFYLYPPYAPVGCLPDPGSGGPNGEPPTPYYDQVRWVEGRIFVNGVEMLRARIGQPGFPVDEFNYYYEQRTGGSWFVGTLDLETRKADETGLVVGTDFTAELEIAWDGCPGDLYCTGGLGYLFEFSQVGTLPSGWMPFTKWLHPNYVMGDTGAPCVDTLRFNLELLDSILNYRNYPTPKLGMGMDRFRLSGVRRRRYLHYRIRYEHNPAYDNLPEWGPDPNPRPIGYDFIKKQWIYPWQGPPKFDYNDDTGYPPDQAKAGRLRFYVNAKEMTTSLDNKYGEWGVLDLDSVELLEYGVQYYLDDVRYAVEDDDP